MPGNSKIMDIEEFRSYCLALPGTSEHMPFDDKTLVFKVGGKMFALAGLENPYLSVNLKCDPERAMQLRQEYEAVQPGYHMNKQHWNTVVPENGLPADLFEELIQHSYDLVFQKLPKKERAAIGRVD